MGVQEALQAAVPMIFIPFFNSQQRLAAKVQEDGYGLVLQFDDLTKETLTGAIDSITSNPEFKKNAVAASIRLNDNLAYPIYESIYWIEYAIRHNGAKHLKSPTAGMSIVKYLMVDVAFFYFSLLLISFLFWVLIIKLCIKRYRAKEQKGKFKYY